MAAPARPKGDELTAIGQGKAGMELRYGSFKIWGVAKRVNARRGSVVSGLRVNRQNSGLKLVILSMPIDDRYRRNAIITN